METKPTCISFLTELKNMFIIHIPDFKSMVLHNPKILIWFFINVWISFQLYFSFTTTKAVSSVIFSCVCYIIFICIVCSSATEPILRKCQSVRRVATSKEKERLYPLFIEVYQKAYDCNFLIGKNVNIYIVDSMEINTFIIGRNTVVITRGILETMDDEEIKGILAHEFGHLSNSDGILTLLINLCTTIYLWIFIAVGYLLSYLEKSFGNNLFGIICGIANQLIQLPVRILYFIWITLISGGSRKTEYLADSFACKLGYTEQLKSALYKIYNIQVSDKKNLIDNLQRSHPILAYRIERLEDNYKEI